MPRRLGALIYLVDAIVKAKFGIMGRFRMPARARASRRYIPYWVPDMLVLDTIQTTRSTASARKGELVGYLRSDWASTRCSTSTRPRTGHDPAPRRDADGCGDRLAARTTCSGRSHPQGAFIGMDMGSLELGIVRDSTLNSTNDFQIFGERFRNLARVAPAQAAYWVTSDLCAVGQFPPAGTARTCD